MTVTPSASGSEPSPASRDDVSALDEYADELGLVMIRSRGPDPEAYARQVDGPGPDLETLVAATTEDGAAEVVLRLRKERQDCGWLGGSCRPYEISACYRWVFDGSRSEREPERLGECPDAEVIDLGPAPVEPHLPEGLTDRLKEGLPSDPVASEETLLQQVRALYGAAAEAAAAEPEVEPDHLLSAAEALGGESVATVGDSVGVAVGVGRECVMVRVGRAGVDVWVPDRMSLMPGEVGCHAAGQLARIGH